MAGEIDYETVEVPAEKTPVEYTYAERRAEILTLIKQAGHPCRINQSQLADRYDCSAPNISKDMAALADHIDETLGDRRELNTRTVLERAIDGLIEQEEWRQAAKTALEYDEWIRENKELEELTERLAALEERHERAKYR